jgi:hypothetical protein
VIDGSKGTLGEGDLQTEVPKHSEGLGTGHFMNQVSPDEKLSRAIGKNSDGMTIPNLLEEGFTHKALK